MFGPCMLCDVVLCIVSSFAIILLRKRERAGCFTLIVFWLSCGFCVLCLFLTGPWVGLFMMAIGAANSIIICIIFKRKFYFKAALISKCSFTSVRISFEF